MWSIHRHSGTSRNLVQHCEPSLRRRSPQPSLTDPPTVIPAFAGIQCNIANHPYAVAAPNRHYQIPQPSFRRKPESMPAGPIAASPNRHTSPFNCHSGESRNLCLPAPLPSPQTVIPPPPTVIPAQAGIQAVKKPYRQPRQSFQSASLTSRNLHAARNPGIPPPSHLRPTTAIPG